ncbi:MAG: thioredoxin fold domain-containing protein [Pseudomonadota bacterium]
MIGLLAFLPQTGIAAGSLLLHDAVGNGNLEAARTAAQDGNLEARDAKGWTPLMVAAGSGNPEMVSLLLAAGATADVSDRLGRTPLHLAAKELTETSRLLIQAGADVDSRNAGGITPLMLAAGGDRREIVDLLLAAGARVDLKDYQGDSVVDWAQRGGNPDLARMLEGHLAAHAGDTGQARGEEIAEDVFVDVQFPPWFKQSFLDLRDDLAEAMGAGKQGLLVFVSTRRCSYCKAFLQNVLSQPDIRRRVRKGFDVVGLEIFDDSEMTDPQGHSYRVKEFVTASKAAYTPTLIFYGEGGRKLLKIVGYYPPERFRAVLDYLEGEHFQRESLRSFLASRTQASVAQSRPIITDPGLFSSPPHMLDRQKVPAARPLVIVFERPGCAACERFHEKVLADKAVRRLLRDYETVQLDASDRTTPVVTPTGEATSPAQWFEALALNYHPAILFFDETGKEVMRLDSETRRFRMEGSLQLVLEKGYEKDAQLQRWRREKAVELFSRQGGR